MTMSCGPGVSDVVRHYGQGISEQSELSLSILRAIDDTVDWLSSIQKEAVSGLAMGGEILKVLLRCKRERTIDTTGDLRDLYAMVEGRLKEVVKALEHKRAAAESDHRLGEHREDLIAEFDTAIDAISQLHDILVELRWAIAEHDADLEEPTGKAFSNAEDMFTSLKV